MSLDTPRPSMQAPFHWIARHPGPYWLTVFVVAVSVCVLDTVAPGKRFFLFPYPSSDPSTWFALAGILIRHAPVLAVGLIGVPVTGLVAFIVARRVHSKSVSPGV
jgi:hypothetical protein